MFVHSYIYLAGLVRHITVKKWGVRVTIEINALARSSVLASKGVCNVVIPPSALVTIRHDSCTAVKWELSRTRFFRTVSFTRKASAGVNARRIDIIMGVISIEIVPNLMHKLKRKVVGEQA